jgi:ornithine cyclodeaminase
MRVYTRTELAAAVSGPGAIAAIEAGFVAYSAGQVRMPPVGYLDFGNPPGDVHIKYGHRQGDAVFVVKIATGFYENPLRGLRSSSGVMLVFSAETGFLQAVLLDEGYLTDLRTAAAGAVAAKYLAPQTVRAIGIVGAGTQARLQLDLLRHVTPCRKAVVWARDPAKAAAFTVAGFTIEVASSVSELAQRCNLIVTTTPAREPLIPAAAVQPGTHITAVGADAPGKQELAAELFARAQVVAVDSRSQCLDHGEAAHAVRARLRDAAQFVELGEIVAAPTLGRTGADQITIADLTGLAIQDIQIAKLACAELQRMAAERA